MKKGLLLLSLICTIVPCFGGKGEYHKKQNRSAFNKRAHNGNKFNQKMQQEHELNRALLKLQKSPVVTITNVQQAELNAVGTLYLMAQARAQ